MRYQTNMKITTLHQHVAVALSLLGAWGCKSSFNVGTIKPDGALSGGKDGNPGTGGSVGTGGGTGVGGAPDSGGALGTGGSTGSGGAGGTLTISDASPVEDASLAAPDMPATEPDILALRGAGCELVWLRPFRRYPDFRLLRRRRPELERIAHLLAGALCPLRTRT
jgi:hypothetical protein